MKNLRLTLTVLLCIISFAVLFSFREVIDKKSDDQSGIVTKVIIHNGCVKVIYEDVVYAETSSQGTMITTKDGVVHNYSPSVMAQIIRKPLK
jgi:hypothetical protein